jgi:hypothetical protein
MMGQRGGKQNYRELLTTSWITSIFFALSLSPTFYLPYTPAWPSAKAVTSIPSTKKGWALA